MTSVRVYTLLTPEQKADVEAVAKGLDRSVAYIIARAIESKITEIADDVCMIPRTGATEKVFARTSKYIVAEIKSKARELRCHDWQAVSAAVQYYLAEIRKCASSH